MTSAPSFGGSPTRSFRRLTDKKVQVRFVKENLTFTGEDTAMATFLLSVLGAFAEFERALIRERHGEGIFLAKKPGSDKGRDKMLNAGRLGRVGLPRDRHRHPQPLRRRAGPSPITYAPT